MLYSVHAISQLIYRALHFGQYALEADVEFTVCWSECLGKEIRN
jgi:hypothetical protein